MQQSPSLLSPDFPPNGYQNNSILYPSPARLSRRCRNSILFCTVVVLVVGSLGISFTIGYNSNDECNSTSLFN